MRRQLLALTLTCAALSAPLAVAAPGSDGPLGTIVAPPSRSRGPDALLVLLADAGLDAGAYVSAAAAAQEAAADRVRLWVAVGGAGAPTVDALPRYALLTS